MSTPALIETPAEIKDFQESMPRFNPPAPVQPQGGWLAIIDRMIDKGTSMEQLGKLLELQERFEKEQARKAYVAALSAFKANAPTLKKNKTVEIASNKPGVAPFTFMHITLAEACRVMIPALAQHGLSHGWETIQKDGGLIEVTCRLSHCAGHSETVMLRSLPDTSGAKNSIQSIGSTVSYLERYTFMAIIGMSAEEADDDGKNAGSAVATIDDVQQAELGKLLAQAGLQGERYGKFLDWLEVSELVDLPAKKFDEACRKLKAEIAKQTKETKGL